MPRYPSNTAQPITVTPIDPDATIDYVFDFQPRTNGTDPTGTDWLSPGELIASHVVSATAGVTVSSSSQTGISVHSGTGTSISLTDNTAVQVWLTAATADVVVTVRITTDSTPARIDDRSIRIAMAEK